MLELGCGAGALGCYVAAVLGPNAAVLTDGGSDGLLRLARKNVAANGLDANVERYNWGAPLEAAWRPDLVIGSDVTYRLRRRS